MVHINCISHLLLLLVLLVKQITKRLIYSAEKCGNPTILDLGNFSECIIRKSYNFCIPFGVLNKGTYLGN